MGELALLASLFVAFALLGKVVDLLEKGIERASLRKSKLDRRQRELNQEAERHEEEARRRAGELDRRERQLQADREAIHRLAKEKAAGFPWLAEAYAEYFELQEMKRARHMETKKRPAPKSAERVREAARRRRRAEKKFHIVRGRIRMYESMFPWLPDFIAEDAEAVDELLISVMEDAGEMHENHDAASDWLSPEEYEKLSSAEKNQLALDRWRESRKSSWEVGREYERYVGYLHEQDGWDVEYQGIIDRFEDLGRDVIARRGSEVRVIQCKRWSQFKDIYEKHIFQHFGTCVEYVVKRREGRRRKPQLELAPDILRNSDVSGLFVTTTTLSDVARQMAEILNIDTWEEFSLDEYPQIKCNVSRQDGEKIYHLPFDQQYDRVRIEPERGERYVKTVHEAERLGFRRAWRWRGTDDSN